MWNYISRNPRKALSVAAQILIMAAFAAWLAWTFREKGGPPEFARHEWTQRDGFMAISYGAMARTPQPGQNSRDQFAEHLRALVQAGYVSVTTEDIINFYNNNKPLPENAVYLMTEGGRKDNAIFGQEQLALARAHAAFFTHTSTLSNWSNFFITYSNAMSIAESPFWDLGSQGYGLININEHMEEARHGFFLCDFLRDEKGERVETDEQMFRRLEDFYQKSYQPLADLMPEPPQAYIFMPANSFSAFMPGVVEEANKELMRRYFKAAFTREGPAFNSALDSVYALSRMRVKPEWTAGQLLEAMRRWRPERESFAVTGPESAEEFTANISAVEVEGGDIVLAPAPGFIDAAMLRGSALWESMRLSVTFAERDLGERHIYLRYSSKDAFLRLTLRANRLLAHERVPGRGLINIYDEVIPYRAPWKMDVLLKGDRLKITLNGETLEPELLPLAATTRQGAVALAATARFDYRARFSQLTAESLPVLWQDAGAGRIRAEKEADRDAVTARILALPANPEEMGPALGNLMQTRAEGAAAIAALPEGDLLFTPRKLAVPPLTEEMSARLWSGVLARPTPGADWDMAEAAMRAIRAGGFKAVLRLSLDTAAELAASGRTVDADYFALDFSRDELPRPLWTALANRHNRNKFLYMIPGGRAGSPMYALHESGVSQAGADSRENR